LNEFLIVALFDIPSHTSRLYWWDI